ncbi:protein-disulfide reductase DsbD family protein [Gymnodinialimonas ceratoperidinii]|uniref:Thioredoxin family protein n=1 Tax=Gymnodinialimonas ceratoperidinii TaxID=2856823 RepID=A0A8F6U093_9RHOB|nr:protein-disulfide reductase DsbD domain-containing protein [Gymnodinialimonas ceratoperidinii]QXT40997.1 thioredoxin family protein [Gymnodinialimonas ceratoperidinii]
MIVTARAFLTTLGLSTMVIFGSSFGALSATSGVETNPAVDVTLITAENWIAPGASSISGGLDLSLAEGWKTYWRSPGEVGLPPEVDFAGSDNVADVEMLWPAPDRFTAFGIQNFGYSGDVVLPLRIRLETPGEATTLVANVSLLVCSDVCVPLDFDLNIDLPANDVGGADAIDLASADQIARFVAQVPIEGPSQFVSEIDAFVDGSGETLTVTVQGADVFEDPDLFPEMAGYTAFGVPDIRLGDGGSLIWAQFPILTLDPEARDVTITLTDGDRAATLAATLLDAPIPAPFDLRVEQTSYAALAWIGLFAILGGLILNVMPCVLPVLSIKLASVVAGKSKTIGEIRASFVASAVGVMAFMWFLAAVTFGLQQIGFTVGWGLQFQNPGFLALMVVILAVFAANMLGLFEISFPSRLQTRMAARGSRGDYAGDFATGAFAAVLATPCSAPFLGTAIAFALTGRAIDIAVVFTGLGLGLALPYFIVAAYPRLAQMMPKPGRWMVLVKVVLGALLLVTAAWLIWVLSGVAGSTATLVTVGLTLALIATITVKRIPDLPKWAAILVLAIAPIVAASQFADRNPADLAAIETEWAVFDRAAIARHVSQGDVVFVDVTADWCLTCQANKLLVLDRDPVASELAADSVMTMRADWTRPSDDISRYLASFGRYGIPFNAVYGPGAPDGIVLSELLSAEAVFQALSDAASRDVATGN